MQTPQTFVVAKAIVTEKNKERPFTACNFKHGDSTGLNAGKKIKDGIVSKACTSALTYVRTWRGKWYHSRARIIGD